jgi:hypothetical protein
MQLVKNYKITHLIIDDESYGEESVTADFTHNEKEYSVTFNKSDLETINTWAFEKDISIPVNLPKNVIDSIRGEVKKRI